MKRLFGLLLLLASPSFAQVFNCSSFSSSGTCGVAITFPLNETFWISGANGNSKPPVLSGSAINFAPAGASHNAYTMNYSPGTVSAQAFTSNFTFTSNGDNIAFYLQNNQGTWGANPGFGQGPLFTAGAGCEGGFYQAFLSGNTGADSVFALELDGYSALNSSGVYSYSSAQVYTQFQSPCNPNDSGPGFFLTNKLSTSPVALNNPSGTQAAGSTDTFFVTLSYDGSNFNMCLIDQTAANGTCASPTSGTGTFYQHTWTNVSIPSAVNGTTAWVGLGNSTIVGGVANDLLVKSWAFTNGTPSATPGGFVAYNASSTTNPGTLTPTSPTYSVAPGTYSGTQTVTISNATSGVTTCYILAASQPTILPFNDGKTGCLTGTLYSSPVSVPSTSTLYAISSYNNFGAALSSNTNACTTSPVNCAASSPMTAAAYTITGAVIPTTISGKTGISGKTVIH